MYQSGLVNPLNIQMQIPLTDDFDNSIWLPGTLESSFKMTIVPKNQFQLKKLEPKRDSKLISDNHFEV
jgi:hypothetical protein